MSETVATMDARPHGGALMRRQVHDHVLQGAILADPCEYGWPGTLALEIALRCNSPRDICEAHNIDRDQWNVIRDNASFKAEVAAAVEALRKEGASFRARAHLQSIELLKENWRMIHDKSTPHAVRADLLKNTFKIAGLDASKDQGVGKAGIGGGFTINLNLG